MCVYTTEKEVIFFSVHIKNILIILRNQRRANIYSYSRRVICTETERFT